MSTMPTIATGWTSAPYLSQQIHSGFESVHINDLLPLAHSENHLSVANPTSIPGTNFSASSSAVNLSVSSAFRTPTAYDMTLEPQWPLLNSAQMSTTGLHAVVQNGFSGVRRSVNGGSGWFKDLLSKGAYWMMLGGTTAATSLGVYLDYDPTTIIATSSIASFFATWALENVIPLKEISPITNKEYSLSILHTIFSSGIFPEILKHSVTLGAAYFLAHECFVPLREMGVLQNFSLNDAPFAAQVVAGLVLSDLGWYWSHRILHKSKPLWKLHEVHHLSENMTTLAAGVNHPANLLINYFILIGVLKLLGIDEAATAVIIGGIVAPNDFLKHSNARIDIGNKARWFLAENKLHGFHHSADPKEYDMNFGYTLMIWDHLFGTYYNPKDRESVDAVGEKRRYMDESKSAFGNFIEHSWYPIRDISQGLINGAKNLFGY